MRRHRAKLIAHINRKDWWHVPPFDQTAYLKRGIFYASSFGEAEFYGRPLDVPRRVKVRNPVVGDEPAVHRRLFGRLLPMPTGEERNTYILRCRLDAKMKKAALRQGYDSIVILSRAGLVGLKNGTIPRSIELNVLVASSTAATDPTALEPVRFHADASC